jgi:hypothetical protein
MRRRSTFVYNRRVDVDPRQLQLSGDVFKIHELKAAREERLTFGFNELPQEVIHGQTRKWTNLTLLL